MKLDKILKKNVFLIVALVFLLGFIGLNANLTGLSIYTFVDTSNETISIPIEENITAPIIENITVEEPKEISIPINETPIIIEENITIPENLTIEESILNLTLGIESNETYGSLLGTLVATITTITLNSTLGTNLTTENITVYTDQDTNASVKLIRNWYLNGSSIAVLNMPFEAGNNTKDYSAYGNNGTFYGATWTSTGGHDSKGAYQFDGVNDKIQITDSNNLDFGAGDNFTITAWFKDFPTGQDQRILYKYDATTKNGYAIFVQDTGENGQVIVATWSADNSNYTDSSSGYNDGLWHFVSFVRNQQAGKLYLYLDGSLINEISELSRNLTSSSSLRIGTDTLSSQGGFPFNGTIDDVMIFNRSLSAQEISALYNNRTDLMVSNELTSGETWKACITPNDGTNDGIELCSNNLTIANAVPTHSTPVLNSTFGTNLTTENLTVYNQSTTDVDGDSVKNIINWYKNAGSITVLNMPFEAGNNTKDYSAYGNNGTFYGATWNLTGGYEGKGAYQFDGVDDYINVAHHSSLNISGSFSMSARVKLKSYAQQAIIRKSGGPLSPGYALDSAVSGNFVFWIINSTSGWNFVNSTTKASLNTWYHVVGIFNGSNMLIYVNGVLENTTAFAELMVTNTSILGIGAILRDDTSKGQFLNGTIDEVTIWNRSLSAQEVSVLYNNRTDLIVSQETSVGETWKACITPNDGTNDGTNLCSNNLTITTDTSAPIFSNPSNDTGIRTNNNITLNINITDNTAVRNYTLEWNNTGTAVNISQFQISGTYLTWYANTSLLISASANQIVWWRYYACDFANNCNVSATYNFTVAITPSIPPDTGGGSNPTTPPTPPPETPPEQPPEETPPPTPPEQPPEEITIPSIEDAIGYVISDTDYGRQHIRVIFDNNTLTTSLGNNTLISLTIIDNKPKIDLDFKLEQPPIEYPHLEKPRTYFLGIYGAIWFLIILLLIAYLIYRETKKEAKEFRREVIRLPSLEITKKVRIFNRFVAEFTYSLALTLIKSFLIGLSSIFLIIASIISRIFLILYYTTTSAVILVINKIGKFILLIINALKKPFITLIISLENIYIKLAKVTKQEIKSAKQVIKELEEFAVKEIKKEHSELQYQRIFSHIKYLLPYFEIEIEKGNYKQICSELDLTVKAFRKLPSALQLDTIEQQLTKQSKAITIGLLLEKATEYLDNNKKKELQEILTKITSYGYVPSGAIKDKLYRYITEYSIDSLRKDYSKILSRLTECINNKDLTKAIEEYANFVAIHNSLLKYWGINKEELVAELKRQQDRLHLLFLREKAYSRIKSEEIKPTFEKIIVSKQTKEIISPTEKKFNKLLTRIKRLLNANELDLAIKHYQELAEFYNSIESTLLAEEKLKIYEEIKDIYDKIVFKELELKAKEKPEIKPVKIKYERIEIEKPKQTKEESSPQIKQFDKKLLRIKKLLRENKLDQAMKEYDGLVEYYNALQGENE